MSNLFDGSENIEAGDYVTRKTDGPEATPMRVEAVRGSMVFCREVGYALHTTCFALQTKHE